MRFLASVLALSLGLTLASAASAQTTYNVANFGLTAYRINNVTTPPLTLARGQTYTFNITAVGHPFYIKTAQVTGTGSQYTNGVTGNGTEEGTLTWTVPANAPNNLFYQCGV